MMVKAWWCRPMVLATQEAKVEESEVQDFSGLQCVFKASQGNLARPVSKQNANETTTKQNRGTILVQHV